MKTYRTVIGKKDFKPSDSSIKPICNWRKRSYKWTVKFHEDAKYELPGSQQGDWLKGGGITKYFSANNKDSVMWAWRYDIEKDLIEIALYINNKNKSKIWKSAGFVKVGEKFTIKLSPLSTKLTSNNQIFSWDGILLRVSRASKNETSALFTIDELLDTKDASGDDFNVFEFNLSRKTGLWFGGTLPANKVLHVDIDYKMYKN